MIFEYASQLLYFNHHSSDSKNQEEDHTIFTATSSPVWILTPGSIKTTHQNLVKHHISETN